MYFLKCYYLQFSGTNKFDSIFYKFKSVPKYDIIWGEQDFSNALFKIQKRGLRLIKEVKNRVPCKSFTGDFKISTVTSYIYIYIWDLVLYIQE
jgi:hypothetical protein